MRYVWDNDMHIHSQLSLCSSDPLQSPERILQYAVDNNLKTVVVTDHVWANASKGCPDWYRQQSLERAMTAKPLPQKEGIEFLFGVETELDGDDTLGLDDEALEKLDFAVIPIDHFHMVGYTISPEDAVSVEGVVKCWIRRMNAVLDMNLPFHKIGFAHLSGCLMKEREGALNVLKTLPEAELRSIFSRCAEKGAGIELNSYDMAFKPEEADTVLRIYRIAKQEKCKFYMGSDAHHPDALLKAPAVFERAIDLLGLTEDDKFHITK